MNYPAERDKHIDELTHFRVQRDQKLNQLILKGCQNSAFSSIGFRPLQQLGPPASKIIRSANHLLKKISATNTTLHALHGTLVKLDYRCLFR